MIEFDLNTNIYRPLQQVFTFVAAPENDFYWQYGTLRSARISEGELCVGALFRTVGHFMGRRIESVYEVTEFNPNKRYGFRSLSGPMNSRMLYTFEIIKGSTRINHSIQINVGETLTPNPISAEKTIKAVKKEYKENLALLKDLLEASRAETLSEGTPPDSHRRRSAPR